MTLYEGLVAAGVELDHHESDLYIRDCPAARRILREHGKLFEGGRKHSGRLSSFMSEGKLWFEVPFGYEPYFQPAKEQHG